MERVPEANIVSCYAYHGPNAEGVRGILRLGGLSYSYLNGRLEQWVRDISTPGSPFRTWRDVCLSRFQGVKRKSDFGAVRSAFGPFSDMCALVSFGLVPRRQIRKRANCADPHHEAQSQRVGLPRPFAALHSPLPHSIYIGSQLIRINAGTFGWKMVNCVGRIRPTSEIGSSRHRGSGNMEGDMGSLVRADAPG
jgi:hypothetical protein